MKNFLCLLAFALPLTLLGQQPSALTLKVGDMAPDFTLPSTMPGGPVKLSDFRGKKSVVLAFYPAAFTGGCTKEMQGYQFNLAKFSDTEAQVFGISTDNTPSQRKFAEELKVAFPMLSDFAKREVTKTYGVLNANSGTANRTTFVVDKQGKIAHIEEGQKAVDVLSAAEACARIAKH